MTFNKEIFNVKLNFLCSEGIGKKQQQQKQNRKKQKTKQKQTKKNAGMIPRRANISTACAYHI